VELVAVGDLVWSRNEATGETALKPVTQLFFTAAKPIYKLTTIAPDGGRETIEVTDNHPYYVIDQGWIDSGKLKPGMRIENFVHGALVVESLIAKNVNEVTYNFTVGDFHTYFVGGQRALVHNCTGACSSASAVNLGRQLTSDEQLANAMQGLGKPIIGAGTKEPLFQSTLDNLVKTYGGNASDWAKMQGSSSNLHSATTQAGKNFEIHWYQNIVTGKTVEFKTKIEGH